MIIMNTLNTNYEQPCNRAVEVSNWNFIFYFDAERRGIKPEKRLKQLLLIQKLKSLQVNFLKTVKYLTQIIVIQVSKLYV